MSATQIQEWVSKLAAALPESFQALDLKAQLVGIATFAHIAKDAKVRDQAMAILATL